MLELRNINKEFPGVKALKDVSITFRDGEIHTLLGENGAGKSTLIKIVSGDYRPDCGEIIIDGCVMHFRNSRDAIDHNIGYVHQEVQIVPESTVAENIILDQLKEFAVNGFINWKRANECAQKYLNMVDLDVKPTDKVSKMTVAKKKLIQIARALCLNASIIMLDEPTASLTESEALNLFKIIERLRNCGTTVIFVSHKLEEVLKISDRISVLRDGALVGTIENKNLEKSDLVTMMVGREIVLDKFMGFLDVKEKNVTLEVQNFTMKQKFEDISFKLYEGELLGFYGLVGSGRTELAKAILSVFKKDEGKVFVNGQEATINCMRDALKHYRIGYVSENRKEEGLFLSHDLKENICVTIWTRIASKILRLINRDTERKVGRDLISDLQIKTTGLGQLVKNLSGGNQQKVSIAKWLAADCDILIIDEPTVGVDVGAKEFIHQIIWDLAKIKNKSIILISSDMPELIKLARRIYVFREGKIVGEIDGLNETEKSYQEVSGEIGKYLA